MSDSETCIERFLTASVKLRGGMTRKWTSPGHRGVPDRIVFWPSKKISFVECKAGRNSLSQLQKSETDKLKSFGHVVHVLSSKLDVSKFVDVNTIKG